MALAKILTLADGTKKIKNDIHLQFSILIMLYYNYIHPAIKREEEKRGEEKERRREGEKEKIER